MSSEMYQEIILDYYRHPRNFGVLPSPEIISHDVNTACGDEITVHLAISNGKISDVKFSGKGCAISLAAASMLTEFVLGKSLSEIANLNKAQVLDLIPIQISPMRLKCALLGFKVLKLGVLKYLGEEEHEN